MSVSLGVFAYQGTAATERTSLYRPKLRAKGADTESLIDLTVFLTESAYSNCPLRPSQLQKKPFISRAFGLNRSRLHSLAKLGPLSKLLHPRPNTSLSDHDALPSSDTFNSRSRGASSSAAHPSPHCNSSALLSSSQHRSTSSDPGQGTAFSNYLAAVELSASPELPDFASKLKSYQTAPLLGQRHADTANLDRDCPVLPNPVPIASSSLTQVCLDYLDARSLTPELTSPSASDLTEEKGAMESVTGMPSPERYAAGQPTNGSPAGLGSKYSSQASLIGMRAEYESASEAESTNQDAAASSAHRHGGQYQTHAQNTANLSGLVCNVHRTTGKEPHPLVGATTTVLGDKLYVFGGRRLSRTKAQLTSSLYELDLVKRHWTKLETRGDTPPPRYFHSVCSLGDTKLVCYGGMSPNANPDPNVDAQQEVVVMSDVHIYDVPSRTWTRLSTPDAPQGRYAHCAAILPSSAVFASPHAPMSAIQHNPPSTNPNQGSLGVALDGTGGAEMVVVGGQDSANHYIEQVSVFNLRSLKWTGTTGMGRSCGAYRSVVTPLTTMTAAEIGAGVHAQHHLDDDDEEAGFIGSGAPMLIYSNYNFLDVKLELQVRLTDGTLTEKAMHTAVSPPGLRFPSGGIIDNHFVVSGTFLTSTKQEYALWALDLRTLSWSRIDAGGSIFSQGSWNRGVLWNRRNAFVVLGNRRRSLVDDYNNRRINFSNLCIVELEAFGLYDNPKTTEPTSSFVSASAPLFKLGTDLTSPMRLLSNAAEEMGALALTHREYADMDFLAIDGTRIPVNSRLIARRWGSQFISLLRESMIAAAETDTATLRPSITSNPSRNSSITITPSINSTATTLTNNTSASDIPDVRSAPPQSRSRLFYLPHTAPTLQALLHYLYTSKLPSPPHALATPQILCSLLQLARPYRVDGLLEAVVERLHECLDGRNAAAIFNAAAMAAGGGESTSLASNDNRSIRESEIPIRTASLIGMEGLMSNGSALRNGAGLRIDTEIANSRTARNTLRPGQAPTANATSDTDNDDDVPDSATTDASISDAEADLPPNAFSIKSREMWNGALSSVVGLQKRGLRGLMEGRRMRERGRGDMMENSKFGLGIA